MERQDVDEAVRATRPDLDLLRPDPAESLESTTDIRTAPSVTGIALPIFESSTQVAIGRSDASDPWW